MSIKILIERKFKEAPNEENLKVIEDMRIKGLRQRGYIGGETRVDVDDNLEVLVISAWSNLDDWRVWLNSKERSDLESKFVSHLQEPVKIKVFMPYTDYQKEAFPVSED